MKDGLLAAIERHETLADSFGNLAEDRQTALDYYLGRPMGNEVEGRSQVVSRDVWDTVEWIKPQLADIFIGGDQVVQFNPVGPEDTQAAEQESEYVNHIITEKNDWFNVWYNWSHDALLQKNGYVIAYYDESEDRTTEEYCGLSMDELALLAQDPEIEIVSAEQDEDEPGLEVKVKRTKQYGCVKIENVPPERVLVSHNSRGLSLQDPRLDFVEYWEYKTITDLRDEGFEVDDNLTDSSNSTQEWQEQQRDELNPFRGMQDDESSPAARRLKVRNCWIRYDDNDDGLTELRRVVVVGKTILHNEETDEVTLYAMCPIPLPHQHNGLSVADAVMDLQQIKTALLRGTVDNVYLANNGRHAIDVNRVNLDDMLVSRPGGVVRVDGPLADAVLPLNHSTTGQVAVPVLEYVDRIAGKRTGVSDAMQGLNPNSLNNSMGAGANNAMISAAQQRIKFIARVFAETGVKALFRGVHALTLKHARKQEIVRMRNQWHVVDPRQWRKRMDMTIMVALGQGDRQQQVMFLEMLMQKQVLAIQAGLASPPKIYNALKRYVQAGGYKDVNEFFDDPATTPPRPPQPNPELLKAQAQTQGQMMLKRMELEAQAASEMRQHQLKLAELRANYDLQASNDMRDSQREELRAEYDRLKAQETLRYQAVNDERNAQIEIYKTDQDNATKLAIAGVNANVQKDSQALQIGHDAIQQDANRKAAKEPADMSKDEAEKLIKSTVGGMSSTLKQLIEMQRQMAEGQAKLEAAVRAKRVLVRDAQGRPSHSQIQE